MFARLALSGVLTSSPQTGAQWCNVDLGAYADAIPDTWALYRDGLLQHMTDAHCDDLLLLARRVEPGIDADSRRWLLQVTDVDPRGLELRIIGPAGGYSVRVPFTRVLARIEDVEAEVHRLLVSR